MGESKCGVECGGEARGVVLRVARESGQRGHVEQFFELEVEFSAAEDRGGHGECLNHGSGCGGAAFMPRHPF